MAIYEQVMADGTKAIMVRFQYKSTRYPVKNFSNLFGCRTKVQAKNKLIEVKQLIAQGKDPFLDSRMFLNDIWEHRISVMSKKGTWSEKTVQNYSNFYDNYLRRPIGSKKIERIKYEDLKTIHNNMAANGAKSRNTIRRILSPIFEEYIKIGVIEINEAKKIDNEKDEVDNNIDNKASDTELEIIKKLYIAIQYLQTKNKKQKEEIHMFLYLLICTGHRRGELIQLSKKDIVLNENKIIAPKQITKTKKEDHYPIPPVCLNYFKKIKQGLLFPTFSYKSIFEVFQRLVKISDVNLYQEKHITPHDIRRIMANIMISDCGIDSALADACLSHKQQGAKGHYIMFSYKDKLNAYSKYWDAITLTIDEYDEKYNKKIIEVKEERKSDDKTDKLFRLADLLEKDLITKEEFIEQKKLIFV